MSDKPRRTCDSYTLCCKLLPVRELGKLAGARCRHQMKRAGVEITMEIEP